MKTSLILIILITSILQALPLWHKDLNAQLQLAFQLSLVLASLVLLIVQFVAKDSEKTKELEEEISKREKQINSLSKESSESEANLSSAESKLAELRLKLEKSELDCTKQKAEIDADNKSLKIALHASEELVEKLKKELSSSQNEDQGILDFIELLQRNGRFMDFVMGDITSIDDQSVGAASRVVHQGLSSLVKEFMSVESIRDESEGESVKVSPGEPLYNYSFIGGDDLSLPKEGRLVHKGWKISKLNLPKRTQNRESMDTVVQRAEVEI